MSKTSYTYNFKWILAWIFIWEFIFWLLFGMVLWTMDAFGDASPAGQLVFRQEENLVYLYILLPLIASFLWFLNWKNRRLEALGDSKVLAFVVKPINSFQTFIRFFFLRNAIVFLILALAQPIFGTKKVSGTAENMELVVAIDVSNSMNTKDIDPETSRLEVVKRAMNQFVNNLHGEKIGISIFAGGSYLQLPLTSDYEAAKMYIAELQTNMVSHQGTDVASALDISAKMFSKAKTSKAILVVTDGENHEGGLEEPLKILKEKNINLAVLGIGTKSGGLIPNNPERPELGHKTDQQGRTIVSKMNPTFIKDLAQKADGFAVVSDSPFPNLDSILERFKHLKRQKIDGIELDMKLNWYQVPLLISILFLVAYVLPINFGRVRKSKM